MIHIISSSKLMFLSIMLLNLVQIYKKYSIMQYKVPSFIRIILLKNTVCNHKLLTVNNL